MNKIISFSLWGNLPIYCKGAIENAKLQKQLYPDWKCRFYFDSSVPIDTINQLNDLDVELVYMFDNFVGFKKLFWRFYVASDLSVDRFIIRDCDSRLNLRERIAVEEWEKSDKGFHIMRDNRFHDCKIMGGMWGGNGKIIFNIKQMIEKYIENIKSTSNRNFYQIDQMFLSDVIWEFFVKNNHIAHDDMKRITGNENYFKVKLLNDGFVGQVYDENNNPFSDNRINSLI